MGVEFLAHRVKLLHAVPLQGLQEVPFRQLDAFDEALNESSALARASSETVSMPRLHVIGHVQHVAGEVRHRIGAGIGDLPLRPAAQVFHVGHQTQELVLQLVFLGLENRYRIDGGFRRLRASFARLASRSGVPCRSVSSSIS